LSKEEKPKILLTKLVVGKGKTSRPSESEEWIKTYYELTLEGPFDVKEFDTVKDAAEATIDQWLGLREVEKRLDQAELDKLPWKPYREGHRAAWIFSETKGAEELANMIRDSKNGKIELGEFTYRFSGPKENPVMFISRTPK